MWQAEFMYAFRGPKAPLSGAIDDTGSTRYKYNIKPTWAKENFLLLSSSRARRFAVLNILSTCFGTLRAFRNCPRAIMFDSTYKSIK